MLREPESQFSFTRAALSTAGARKANQFQLYVPAAQGLRNSAILLPLMILWIGCHVNVLATVLYVDVNGTNATPPYADWSTAATNIQDAVDAASPGDNVRVTNGVYQAGSRSVNGSSLANRVAVDKPLTVESVNGPVVTIIKGISPVGNSAVRCVYLTNGAALIGFTLTNGATRYYSSPSFYFAQNGGGAWCASASGILSNCVLTGNSASSYGGGVYGGTLNSCTLNNNSAPFGGGAAGSTLNNCTLTGNSAYYLDRGGGGGAIGGTLNQCVLAGNSADFGGGVENATLNNCVVSSNGSIWQGGGASGGTLNNCVVNGNSSASGGGADRGTLNNCVLIGNSAWEGGGASGSTLNNCSLASNSAGSDGGGAMSSTLNGCIAYYNTAPSAANCSSCSLLYCCSTPLPPGAGNFTNAPLFVDLASGNLRLQSSSACINAGKNAYVTTATDLDGNPRIVGGTVDVGAFEFQSPSSILSYAWAQQNGLPTDGTADFEDSDGDSMNNWQEWRTGTDPTDPSSVLKMLSPSCNSPDITVTWRSVSGVNYCLQRCTNLAGPLSFCCLASNIVGQAGTTSFSDTNAVGTGPSFYRVGVQ